MSYNPNIPQTFDPILKSQKQIKANFIQIDQAFANNHKGLTQDESISGKHTIVSLRPQTLDPTTTANQVAIYNKLVSTVPQVFFRPNSNQTPIQLTYSSFLTNQSNAQYSFVAGPFVWYFGFISPATNGQTVILSPATTLKHVSLTTANAKFGTVPPAFPHIDFAIPTAIAANQFNITIQAATGVNSFDVYYMAIGQP